MKMKKLFSALLSVAMLATMSVPAFAAKHENKLASDPELTAELKFNSYASNQLTLDLILDSSVLTQDPASCWDDEDDENYFYDAIGIQAISLVYEFKDGYATAISNPKITNWYGAKAKSAYAGNLAGNRFTIGGNGQYSEEYFGPLDDDYVAAEVKITLNSAVTAGKSSAQIKEMFENNELGELKSLSATIVENGPSSEGRETIKTQTTVGTVAADADYAWKSITPAIPGSTPSGDEPVVPTYTAQEDSITDTKTGSDCLYWLINFTQVATDKYLTARINRYNSSDAFLKQNTICIGLDADDKFQGEGQRAAYIFMTDVPEGKYKATFNIGASEKFDDGELLFADSDYLVVAPE